jgi:peptidyl-prolyl cis-trans isomerase C
MSGAHTGCGCGGGGGGCGSGKTAALDVPISGVSPPLVTVSDLQGPMAQVNGVPLHGVGESLDPEALRQRAYSELLRQAAQRQGLLPVGDAPALDGVLSEAASAAIETLLAQQLTVPEPDELACQRYFDAHATRFAVGEQVHARHILFGVTPGVDVDALRRHAEGLLVSLRCGDAAAFAEAAAANSNCPSGQEGGDLGWLGREDCVPEFATAVLAQDDANAHVGVLPRLVSTRFGFHIIRVEARRPGQPQRFEAVKSAIAQTLRQQTYVTALRQYLNLLAGAARIDGVLLEGADSPLLQ